MRVRERGLPEVKKLAKQLWRETNWREMHVEFTKVEGGYDLKVSQMYEFVPVDFRRLSALSAFFGTREIDVNNWAQKGCDTCDHGSNYAVTFQIREEKGKP